MTSEMMIITFIVATTYNDKSIILSCPTKDFDITMMESIFIEDEPFINIDMIPRQVGIYEVECKYYLNDECNFGFNRTDSNYEFEILDVRELCRF